MTDERDPEDCPRCGEVMRERRVYDCQTHETRVVLYCYDCENDDLIRLARSVGK